MPPRSTRPAVSPPDPRPTPTKEWPPWLIGLLIYAATLLAYGPALGGGFIWDDAGHVTRADLQPVSGLWRIWFEVAATQQYYPTLHTAFWIEHRLWGDSPLGYHLLNVLLHATAACLLGTVLRKLAVPGAWLAAALFALHPVGVESVAWIAEQKNTLSAVLYFTAALAYLRFDDDRRGPRYVVATAWFLAALLTKTVTATLPAALLVAFWWRRGALSWRRDLVPLLPWFVGGAGAGYLTAWFERTKIGAEGVDFALSGLQRLQLAGRAVAFYLGKLAWPSDLIFIYPRWTIDPTQWWQWLPAVGVLALLAGLWRYRQRGALAGALFFVGTLFPALGFVNVFPFVFSFVADHFQYLAAGGVFAVAAAGWVALRQHWAPGIGHAVCVATLAGLGVLTWNQSTQYRDAATLYETTLARNPACWLAHNNLAMLLANAGRAAEAIPHLEAALRLRPDFPQAENNFGDDLRQLGRPAEAIPHLRRALALQPGYAEAHGNLGVALLLTGQSAAGIAELHEALRLKPDYPMARNNLGLARADTGHPEEALAEFAEAVRLDPDFGEAELNWAMDLTTLGRLAEARPHFERALRLQPDSPGVRVSYGSALASAGLTAEAIRHYEEALALNPGLAEAHLGLAQALRQVGRIGEANAHDQEAARLGAPPRAP